MGRVLASPAQKRQEAEESSSTEFGDLHICRKPILSSNLARLNVSLRIGHARVLLTAFGPQRASPDTDCLETLRSWSAFEAPCAFHEEGDRPSLVAGPGNESWHSCCSNPCCMHLCNPSRCARKFDRRHSEPMDIEYVLQNSLGIYEHPGGTESHSSKQCHLGDSSARRNVHQRVHLRSTIFSLGPWCCTWKSSLLIKIRKRDPRSESVALYELGGADIGICRSLSCSRLRCAATTFRQSELTCLAHLNSPRALKPNSNGSTLALTFYVTDDVVSAYQNPLEVVVP
jgi:hypothetical protein